MYLFSYEIVEKMKEMDTQFKHVAKRQNYSTSVFLTKEILKNIPDEKSIKYTNKPLLEDLDIDSIVSGFLDTEINKPYNIEIETSIYQMMLLLDEIHNKTNIEFELTFNKYNTIRQGQTVHLTGNNMLTYHTYSYNSSYHRSKMYDGSSLIHRSLDEYVDFDERWCVVASIINRKIIKNKSFKGE